MKLKKSKMECLTDNEIIIIESNIYKFQTQLALLKQFSGEIQNYTQNAYNAMAGKLKLYIALSQTSPATVNKYSMIQQKLSKFYFQQYSSCMDNLKTMISAYQYSYDTLLTNYNSLKQMFPTLSSSPSPNMCFTLNSESSNRGAALQLKLSLSKLNNSIQILVNNIESQNRSLENYNACEINLKETLDSFTATIDDVANSSILLNQQVTPSVQSSQGIPLTREPIPTTQSVPLLTVTSSTIPQPIVSPSINDSKLYASLNDIQHSVQKLQQDFDRINHGLPQLESNLNASNIQFKRQLDSMGVVVDNIYSNVSTQDDLSNSINSQYAKISGSLDMLRQQMDDLTAKYNTITDTMNVQSSDTSSSLNEIFNQQNNFQNTINHKFQEFASDMNGMKETIAHQKMTFQNFISLINQGITPS